MKKVNAVLNFEDKEFTNDKGDVIAYTAITADIGGEEIRLSVKTEDKGLLRSILKRIK